MMTMANDTPRTDQPTPPERSRTGASRLPPRGETTVSHEEDAAKQDDGKTIHRRRPLPPVPEKPEKDE